MTLTLDDMLVRAEIEDVLQSYVRGIDRVDLDRVLACYHPDGYDDHGTFSGPASEFVKWLGDGRLDRHEASMHFYSTPLVRRTEPDVCQVDTYCMTSHVSKPVDGERIVTKAGLRYLDRFERRDGRWLIAHRRVLEDWRHQTRIPERDGRPVGPDHRIGRRDRADRSYEDVPPSPTAATSS